MPTKNKNPNDGKLYTLEDLYNYFMERKMPELCTYNLEHLQDIESSFSEAEKMQRFAEYKVAIVEVFAVLESITGAAKGNLRSFSDAVIAQAKQTAATEDKGYLQDLEDSFDSK